MLTWSFGDVVVVALAIVVIQFVAGWLIGGFIRVGMSDDRD